jgi:hypothetical protein
MIKKTIGIFSWHMHKILHDMEEYSTTCPRMKNENGLKNEWKNKTNERIEWMKIKNR